MKNRLLTFSMLILTLLFCGCSTKNDNTVIWQTSDIHYISPELIEDMEFFEDLMEGADGKATQYISEITDAFIAEAVEAKPDAVIISGDLTLNGAKLSHEELAARLGEIKETGIKVLVIPGNHDITRQAYRFTADGVEPAESITADEFRSIWNEFGFSDAIAADEKTLSYVSEINEGLRILMVDVNTALKGSVPASTLKWIEQQLKDAQTAGARVIAVSHQNLFIHDRLFNFGYQINNSDKLAELYEKYGVRLNLSGHLHIQHWTTEGNITDIATSSLAVSPNQYGVLTVGDDIHYQTCKTAVSVPGIEDFAAWSRDWFDISNSKFANEIPDEFSPSEKEEMTDLARDMNRGLFSGYIADTDESILAKWETVPGFTYKYLNSMRPGIGTDFNTWDSAR